VANNINIITSLLNKVTGKNNKNYYDWLEMWIVSFLTNIEKYKTDNKKWISVNSFTYNWIKYAVKEVNNIESSGVKLIWNIHQIKSVTNYFKTVKFLNNDEKEVFIDDNLLLLEKIIENIATFDNVDIKKVWSNIMMILPSYKITMDKFIKMYYDNSNWEITKANLLDTDDNIDIFKANIRNFIDTEQFIHKSEDKPIKNNSKRVNKRTVLEERLVIIAKQLDYIDNKAQIWELYSEDWTMLSWDYIDSSTDITRLWWSMDAAFFRNILENEIFQRKGHKCNLTLRDRIILWMTYDSFFKMWEAYYLLQDYFDWAYPKTFIKYIGQFWFYNCPSEDEIEQSTTLNDYWKQYFRDTLDAVKVSNIAKIFWLSESGIKKIDINIKTILNSVYEVIGSDWEYILHFDNYEYQKRYTESKTKKEDEIKTNYKRELSQEDSDNMEDIIRDMIEIRKWNYDKLKGNYLKNYNKLDNKQELKKKIEEEELLRLERENRRLSK